MNGASHVVAVLGAGSEVGREVAAVLRERAFPVDVLRLYDDAPDDQVFEDDEGGEEIFPLDEVELTGADVVFLCDHPERAAEWAARAATAGALVIDLTQVLAESGQAPLVVPEVNPGAIRAGLEVGMLAAPVPTATALAVVLKPIHTAAELKRVVVTALEPASIAGRPGIDELAEQSRQLLSGATPENRVFPQRIAFNLIPAVGDFLAGGRTRAEWLIESQLRHVLELPDLPITVTSVLTPTFFGQVCAAHVETEGPLDAVAATALLRHAPGLLLSDEPPAYPTLAEVIGSEATHVGRVRDDLTVPYGLALWIAIDGLRKGAAVNAVQIAERALRERA
jgi:aspartate-semialdehyde dehydrogenase